MEEFPEWIKRIEDWQSECRKNRYEIKAEARIRGYEQKFASVWVEIEERGGRTSVFEFAKMCGVKRDMLYDEFPHWIQKIKAWNSEISAQLKHKFEAELLSSVAAGEHLSLYALAIRCGVHRNVIKYHWPEIEDVIRNYKNAGSKSDA